MPVDLRIIESGDAVEYYLTVVPSPGIAARDEAHDVFGAIAQILRTTRARIVQERVFAAPDAIDLIRPARAAAYGALDDGVPPAWLAVPLPKQGAIAGAQVHALRCAHSPTPLRVNDAALGRVLEVGGRRYVTLSGLAAPTAGTATAQARATFESAETLLRRGGTDILSVVRTWVWLGDILAWYDDFNDVRNRFFNERGLLNRECANGRMPASTGIGVKPAGESICGLDLIAIAGAPDTVRLFGAAGNQDSAYEYGSAFSRAARATMPAGDTVFVSGTAAIDAAGFTQHIGDPGGQIRMTLDNVRAVLSDMGCGEDDIVQAIVYVKDSHVREVFCREWRDLAWPYLTILADVCRPDLLFEIEVTACPGARSA